MVLRNSNVQTPCLNEGMWLQKMGH